MLIGQISDFHVTGEGKLAYGRVDTPAMLARAVEALNRVSPQPDLVIGSGDLVQTGGAEEYACLRRILGNLKAPFAPMAGNHDARSELRDAFRDQVGNSGPGPFIQYVRDLRDLRLVVIDTVTEGSDEPSFCQARAAWLEEALAADDRPVVIAMHHPPFPCGIDWLEPKEPGWSDLLAEAVDRSSCVIRFLAGHVHRAIHATWRGVPASTCPSTAHQVFPALGAGEPTFCEEAAGFQLHRWTGRELVTYTASTVGFGLTFPAPPHGRA